MSAAACGYWSACSISKSRAFFKLSLRSASAVSLSMCSVRPARVKHGKPPDVLVYANDDSKVEQNTISMLKRCLTPDCYTVYPISKDSTENVPWQSSTALLVIPHQRCKISPLAKDKFIRFFENGGCVLSFGNISIDHELVGVASSSEIEPSICQSDGLVTRIVDYDSVVDASSTFTTYHHFEKAKLLNCTTAPLFRHQGFAVISQVTNAESGGNFILSNAILCYEVASEIGSNNSSKRVQILRKLLEKLHMKCDDQKCSEHLLSSAGFLHASDGCLQTTFVSMLRDRFPNSTLKSKHLTLRFVDGLSGHMDQLKENTKSCNARSVTDSNKHSTSLENDCQEIVEVFTNGHSEHFDDSKYFESLKAGILGRLVVYFDVISSTMHVFDALLKCSIPKHAGMVAIARQQSHGKGRQNNAWLSPVGSASFSLDVRFAQKSPLGTRMSFLQHVAALAVATSVQEQFPQALGQVKLKWPNDIYDGNGNKIGGVLVTSSIVGQEVHCIIGIGVNVNNALPTVSLSQVVQEHNITIETFIAETINHVEILIEKIQTGRQEEVTELYYKFWMHTDEKVTLHGGQCGVITGVDVYGFLQVQTGKEKVAVQPDGNSFDILHNLIRVKS